MTDSNDLFNRHLPLIDQVIRSVCRKKCLSADEAEDFQQEVYVKLLENDCERLRQFDGRSKMKTFLTTVVMRLWFDQQRQKPGGRWRPSAAAEQLGAEAVALERLMVRDGFSFEEAAEQLRRNHGVTMSIEELADLAGKLPPKWRPRREGEQILEQIAARTPQADEHLLDQEREDLLRRQLAALQEALLEMSAEDRLFLQLLYEDGLPMSRIAKMLDVPQRSLYSRRDRLLKELRKALQRKGLSE